MYELVFFSLNLMRDKGLTWPNEDSKEVVAMEVIKALEIYHLTKAMSCIIPGV